MSSDNRPTKCSDNNCHHPQNAHSAKHGDSKTTYKIEGLTCAHCASTFEDNLNKLPNVTCATVNFAASKVAISGDVSLTDITKAGAFENLQIFSEDQEIITIQKPFYQQPENIKVCIAAIVLAVTYFLSKSDNPNNTLVLVGYLATMIIGGYTLFWQGLKNLSKLIFDMNTLMTIAIIGAVIIGEYLEGAAVVILFAINEALEAYSMDKTRQSIQSLIKMAPQDALVKQGNEWKVMPIRDVEVGNIVLIKPAQKVPMDGEVISGHSSLNQAAITGESMPVNKTIGDEVFAGTLNEEGALEVRVTKAAKDSTLAKIVELVEEAQLQKAPAQQFIDHFAKYYTPIIMMIAALIAIVPPLFFGANWYQWIYQGLAVLVVGCPCALVISTPVAIVTAIGHAAKKGILIKGGIYLEVASQIKAIAFDKTGTLTKGSPEVTEFIVLNNHPENDIYAIAKALEIQSQHPLSKAIVSHVNQQDNIIDKSIANFQAITGKGIQADIDKQTYYIGNPALFEEYLKIRLPETLNHSIIALQQEQKTVMLLGTSQEIIAYIAAIDSIRDNAASVIKQLHQQNIKTIMLTGDNSHTAQKVANQIGIDQIQANLLPQDKLQFIQKLQTDIGKTAMVGDGVNDAPALAASSLGIAMGQGGTDTALETANIAFMQDDLSKLPYVIQLSRRTTRIIKQNIGFSLSLKLLALLLVIPGWLTLWIAILADMGATILVTLNSLRLMKENK